jgi:putative ATPase
MKNRPQFYRPVERGFEREIRKRLDYWQKLRHQKSNGNYNDS